MAADQSALRPRACDAGAWHGGILASALAPPTPLPTSRQRWLDEDSAALVGSELVHEEPLYFVQSQRRAQALARCHDELFDACTSGDVATVKAHIAAYGNSRLRLAGRHGLTALHLAAGVFDRRAAVEICQALITARADVNAPDERSNTPLHLCAQFHDRNLFVGRLLIAWHADTRAKNVDGKTPYDIAVKHGGTKLSAVIRGATPQTFT